MSDPTWYKDAILYELHVRAFADSNGDGIGDFRGLIGRLDYLRDLGVTALWLLPFYPSPLRDDGYDISDYRAVNPDYGTLDDFRHFLDEAHRRDLLVITELVVNHTSMDHTWFQRARRSPPGSVERDFYVWSDDPKKYAEARIIFQDFETSNWSWDPVAKAYYWHRFYHHQPDLNFDNPAVREALFEVLDFWMGMGVDGMRLDAVPYLYQREGTNCENLPETHVFLKELRRTIDERYEDRMLLAEANQWPEDAAAYFGDGDECHMNFHFPVMPRMFMAVQNEDRFAIIDILDQTPAIPEQCQWAVFLRNHDELTLEMVTDEDRDYMYRVYADDPRARVNLGIRRRLAPLLKDRRKVELMTALLFSLPGTPVLYYGDEIGMGDNIYLGDRDAVRTPMQWSPDRNAGFSTANPQRLYLPIIVDPEYHAQAINVEAQQNNPTSPLWWNKHLIALRKQHRVFGRGSLRFLHPDNPRVLAFLREHEDDPVLCVFNLSRFAQYAELDLADYEGHLPREMMSRNTFPRIGELPYLLTLGPHAWYWFALEPSSRDREVKEDAGPPHLEVEAPWTCIVDEGHRRGLERAFTRWLPKRRWYRGKARHLKRLEIREVVPIPAEAPRALLLFLRAEYVQHESEVYAVPLAFTPEEHALPYRHDRAHMVIAELTVGGEAAGVLHDAMGPGVFLDALLDFFDTEGRVSAPRGELFATTFPDWGPLRGEAPLEAHIPGSEQSNTSIVWGDRLIFKLFRVIELGTNPDLEVGRFLTRVGFPHTPPMAGALEYCLERKPPTTVGVVQGFQVHEQDAWSLTVEAVELALDRALTDLDERAPPESQVESVLDRSRLPIPEVAREIIGPYLSHAELLGRRTAEMHLALASDPEDPDFRPDPFSQLYQRSLYQSGRTRLGQTLDLLRKRLEHLPEGLQPLAREVLERRHRIDGLLKRVVRQRIDTVRIRCHNDFHLGQVLFTGKDFVLIDFEGEPARAIGERRFKVAPLRDVAGMLRSFHYATVAVLRGGRVREEDADLLAPWAAVWHRWVTAAYLRGWLARADGSPFVPPDDAELSVLLEFYLVEKCIYELGYELDNRPEMVFIPLRGLLELLEETTG